jgi:deoxyinosine 3'endonuclease (endonuclease V)
MTSSDESTTRPIYVSSGHRVSLATSLQLALVCTKTGRLPEPIRQADKTSRAQIIAKGL